MPAAAADPTKREISGFFLSQEKFGSHCDSLASPACGTVSLRLFHNEPQHTAAVLQALRDNTSVTSLDIFELDPASASTLGSLLASNPRLTSLAIHHAHGFEAATRLAAGLAANTGLTQLHFSQLDARGVTAIANAVAAWASAPHGARLQHLRLDKSLLNAEAAAALAAALGPQAAALARLAVVESDMGGEAAAALLGSPGWAALTAALTELDLSSCHLGPQAGELLGRFLAAPGCRLAALALSNNRLLGPGGATALAAGLAANASLRRLDLANCGVTAPGVVALAAALRPEAPGGAGSLAAPPLQQLCLNDNAAGAEGLLALLCAMSPFPLPRPQPAQHVEGLLPPCGLRTLQLDSNQIRGIDLAEAMGVAAPPKILSPAAAAVHQLAATLAAAAREARAAATAAATANGSEVEEAPSARRLVHVAGPLEQVSLAGNALYDAGTTALAAALGGAPSLESLDLRENGISDAGVAALLPLVGGGAGADGRRMLGGASRRGSAGGAGSGSSSVGLQGLVLDGNRIHNSGGQALLEAVTAAPGLWRFSAEANKLTDPALRLSLTQLSQLRAARRSQLLVLGRQYSSSSSSSGEDPEGQGQNGRRGSGGGGGGADSGRRSDGGGDSHRNSMEEEDRPPSQQHQQQPQNGGGGGNVAGAAMDLDDPQENDGHFRHHHHHHQHKHRLDEGRAGGGNSSGDDDERSGERRPSAGGRNVAARAGLNGGPHDIHVSAGSQAAAAAAAMLSATAAAADGPAWRRAGPATMDVASSCNGNGCSDAALTGGVRRGLHAMAVGAPCGGGGGGLGGGCGGAHPMAIDSQPCMPSSAGCGGGGGRPPSVGGASSHDSLFGSYDPPSHLLEAHGFRGGAMAVGTPSRHAPAGVVGARFGGSSSGGVAGGGGGGTMATSPPPAMCYATAMTGVGGAGSVGVSKQAGGGRGGGGGGGGASGHDFKSTPQQILPACRRPRYKPLTPEQQRMFEDF